MDDCRECVVLNIEQMVPLGLALPIYGYLMPFCCVLTTLTNSTIILILTKIHLRTPTNFVLVSMAVMDLITGIAPLPWFLYYYSFGGYKEGQLGTFWCRAYPFFSYILPAISHAAAVWLTVFLAIQRLVYVCFPAHIHRLCTPKVVKTLVVVIVCFAFLTEAGDVFGKIVFPIQAGNRSFCVLTYTSLVHYLGIELFYTLHYSSRAIFVHILPCIMLTVFTYKLSRTIDRRTEMRKKSWASASISEQPSGDGRQRDVQKTKKKKKKTTEASLIPLEPSPQSSTTALEGKPPTIATRINYSRSHHATTKMLFVICLCFLLLEVPAGLIYLLHTVIAISSTPSQTTYKILNVALIVRNLLIILTSPVQFSIYCSMSEPFRLTFRQLFSSKTLFIAQAQATFHGTKRYSLVLVDVDAAPKKRHSLRRHHSDRSVRKNSRNTSAQCAPNALECGPSMKEAAPSPSELPSSNRPNDSSGSLCADL